MFNLIKKVINLYEKYAKRKPEAISLGFLDYAVFKNSDRFSPVVDGVLVNKKTWPAEGIFIENSLQEITPYVTIMEEMANYENRALKPPNYITISKEFFNIYKEQLGLDGTDVYNTTLNCIIGVDDDQIDDVICEYKSLVANDIDNYSKVINSLEFYFEDPEEPIQEEEQYEEDDESEDDSYCFRHTIIFGNPFDEDKEEEEEKSDKDKFIDWLLDDEDALIEAYIYVDEHSKEIDEDFDYYFIKSKEFEKWLEDNGKGDDKYYGYY